MNDKKVGRIKNFVYNQETRDLEITLIVEDNKFKKKILRDFSLAGKLKVDGEFIYYEGSKDGEI
jgi:hypothetical protein